MLNKRPIGTGVYIPFLFCVLSMIFRGNSLRNIIVLRLMLSRSTIHAQLCCIGINWHRLLPKQCVVMAERYVTVR